MSCCGRTMQHWDGGAASRGFYSGEGPVYYRYLGKSALTVIGPVTGRAYRFTGEGSTLASDPRDAPSLAAVPRLIQVRKV